MNLELLNRLEKMIITPQGELKELIDSINHDGILLSDPKRTEQKEKYYIVLNHLYLHHFHHKRQAKGAYNKGGAKYLLKELSSDYMRSKVGRIWTEITKKLREKNIIQRGDDCKSDKDQKLKKGGKKTDKNYCGNSNNHLNRPFALCYRLSYIWQDDVYWDLKEIEVINKLDPPNIRDKHGELNKCNITIDVNPATKSMNQMAKERAWSRMALV